MALMDVRSTITSIELCQCSNIFRFDFRFKNLTLYPSWTGHRCNLKIRQSLQVAIRFRWNIILSISITIIECKVHINLSQFGECALDISFLDIQGANNENFCHEKCIYALAQFMLWHVGWYSTESDWEKETIA